MHIILILLVIAGGMGLSVEAGLLGPLGAEVGDLWAAFSIFSVGTGLTFLLMLFFSPATVPHFLRSLHGTCWAACSARFTSSFSPLPRLQSALP